MSLLVLLLLTGAATAYVAAPLFGRPGPRRPASLAAAPTLLIADGVTYESEEEWAVDRKLGKVGEAEPEMRSYRALAYLEEEIEQRVATIRAQRREARARSKRTLCAGCGKAFQAGDRYCARCGEAHPNSCPKCGERHHASDRYCTRCGMVLPRGAG